MSIINRIGVATMSCYKPEWSVRFACACKNTFELAEMGIKHFNLDDSEDPLYGKVLWNLGAEIHKAPKGIGPSKRNGVNLVRAFGCDLVLMSEIEKFGLAEHIPGVMEKIADGTYDIIHFCRTEVGWNSYPEFQRKIERENAVFYADKLGITGIETDTWLGPVGFSAAMADELVMWKPEDHGVPDTYLNIYFPVFAARKLGAKVGFVQIPFTYPLEQRIAEEGILGPEMERRRINQMKIRDGVSKLAAL